MSTVKGITKWARGLCWSLAVGLTMATVTQARAQEPEEDGSKQAPESGSESEKPAEAKPEAGPSKEALAAARQLFKKALAHELNKEWAEALADLEKVGRVKMTPQVRYHIALCQENLGRLVDALNGFELAEQEAKSAGVAAVAEQAPLRAKALRERVAYLTIRVTGTIRTSRILIDDREIDTALLGAQIPVDPGKHVLSVKRGDDVIEQRSLELAAKQQDEIVLEIDDPEPPPEPDVPAPTGAMLPRADESNPRVPAYITMGVGAAILAGSGVFFALRQTTLYNLDCDTIDPNPLGPTASGCNPDSEGTANLAQTYTHVTNAMVGVGGATALTGLVLFFVLGPDDDPEPAQKTSSEATGQEDGEPLAPTSDSEASESSDDSASILRSLRVAPTFGGVQITGRF